MRQIAATRGRNTPIVRRSTQIRLRQGLWASGVCRVDEDRDNDVISEFVGLPNEFQMASVQRSHSHDERHAAFKGTKSRC